MISVSGLSHQIGKSLILNDINVDIAQGSVTALIGPNGAGKSTLLNLISRKETVRSGEISLDDSDMATIPPSELALRLSSVAQDIGVASRLRIRDLVAFGRWPHAKGNPSAHDIAKINDALDEFDLTDLSDRFLDEVSGGQRQRAFVAMAYAQETDWMLLDEPLNNLDLRYARSLMAKLDALCKQSGKGILIVLHDLNYAASWADRIIAMKNGKIEFTGPTQNVLTSQKLSALYDSDVCVTEINGKPYVRHHR